MVRTLPVLNAVDVSSNHILGVMPKLLRSTRLDQYITFTTIGGMD